MDSRESFVYLGGRHFAYATSLRVHFCQVGCASVGGTLDRPIIRGLFDDSDLCL